MTLLKPGPDAPGAWHGNLPVTSRYTFGLAGERFFRAIKDKSVILGSHCEACDRTYVPATMFCERCLAELDKWVDVGTKGVVLTYTVVYVNVDGSHRESPEVVAFIRIEDGGLIHRLGEVLPAEVAVGMPVKAVFKSAAEREGSILDIVHFRPVV
jgi:uncharacterized OB-fold protein